MLFSVHISEDRSSYFLSRFRNHYSVKFSNLRGRMKKGDIAFTPAPMLFRMTREELNTASERYKLLSQVELRELGDPKAEGLSIEDKINQTGNDVRVENLQ